MSLKEFWEESPELFWIYRFNWIKKQKEEEENRNRTAWFTGIYVRQAIVSALSDSKPVEYYKKPIDFYATEEDRKKEMVDKNVALLKAQFIRSKKILDSKKSKENDKGE